ncbi:MAG: lipocalin family protein [Pseudomonadota bacterium]
MRSIAFSQEVKTVDQLDLNRYLGTWHEVARFPARFQRGCKDAKAVYKKIGAGKISVVNSCTRNGEKSVAEGNAVVTGTGRLGVRFSVFQPFRAPYWVLWIDKGYQTAVVGDPSRKYGWILSRIPDRDRSGLTEAINAFEKNGYDTSKLIWN